jgi:hypothetical protein
MFEKQPGRNQISPIAVGLQPTKARPNTASVHYRDTDIRDVGHNKNIEVVTQLTGMQVCHP